MRVAFACRIRILALARHVCILRFACHSCALRVRICSCIVRFCDAYVRSHSLFSRYTLRVALTLYIRTSLAQTRRVLLLLLGKTTSRILDFDLVVVFFFAKEKSCCMVHLGEREVGLEWLTNRSRAWHGENETSLTGWEMLDLGGGKGGVCDQCREVWRCANTAKHAARKHASQEIR